MSAVFHHAVVEGDVTKVRFLLKYSPGLRINSTNNYGLTAVQHAAQNGNVDMVNFLLEQGADLSCVDQLGRTALHLASQEGHLGVVSLLVTSACANVNAKTERGEKAIDLAKTDQVRALLSQAMLTESFKRKCSLESDDLESSYSPEGYRNTPGCRYSLSSVSTDSGVYDDSSSSQDSFSDPKYSYRFSRGGSLRGYQSSAYSTISEDSGVSGLSSTFHRSRYLSRLEEPATRARRLDGSPVRSILKSQSFSGNRNGEWNPEDRSPRQDKIDSAREEMLRYRRQEKTSYARDPTRRRTVTFGETEKVSVEQDRPSTSVTYNGSYSRPLPHVPPRSFTPRNMSEKPPPIPPRIPPRNSARSSSLKARSPNDNEVVFRPRPCPRAPRSELGILQGNTQKRMSMFAEISTKGMH